MSLPEEYQTDEGFDPCEDHIGPFYYKRDGDRFRYAFRVEDQHCNTHGIVHGGVLMTFADYALCMEATSHYADESCITVSFSCEFVSAARLGSLVECTANVTRKTGSLTFVTGEVMEKEDVIFTFSAVVKRLKIT